MLMLASHNILNPNGAPITVSFTGYGAWFVLYYKIRKGKG